MATFKDMEDSLRKFMLDEQSDAHNIKSVNIAKYNNMKIWMEPSKYQEPHFIVRITISEAVFSLSECTKINGGLGFEERLVLKWFGRMGIKSKLQELWGNASSNNGKEEN